MKIAVIGLGKMGASLCADLKAAGSEIAGTDADPRAVDYCVSENLVDEGFSSPADIPADTGVYVLAVPVEFMGDVARELFSSPRPGAVVTDMGSVKEPVMRSVEDALPAGAFFVPAHPIAGDEKHGAQSGGRGIFQGKPVIITGGEGDALAVVEDMWKKTGARIVRMTAGEHDRMFAFLSHLPHVCAYALASAAATAGRSNGEAFALSGGGLDDTTRIAMSDPELWAGILVENSAHVLAALERFTDSVAEVAEAVRAGDKGALAGILERGRAAKALFRKDRPAPPRRL